MSVTTPRPVSVEDRLAAIDLVTRYFRLVDHGRAGEVAALFARDGTITFAPPAPNPGTIAGPDIAPAMAARQALTHVTTRHVLTNMTVSHLEAGRLHVSSLLTLFRSDDESRSCEVASVADIEDVLAGGTGQWQIKSRLITPVFYRG